MKRRALLLAALCCTAVIRAEPMPQVSAGRIERHENFPSRFVDARHVDVWLPEGYGPEGRYSVIYMHDGQMLFDAAITWNKQEWKVTRHSRAS